MTLFEELILISLGKQEKFSKQPSADDWKCMHAEAQKQSILGVLLSGIERLPAAQRPPELTLMAWFGYTNIMAERNKLLDKRASELTAILKEGGFSSCILKGQGVARLYPKPERRTSGDIDIWVSKDGANLKDRVSVLEFLKVKGSELGDVVIHHVDAEIFNDAPVEIHFLPNYSYSPFRMKKYMKFFTKEAKKQFDNIDVSIGFAYPTHAFNAVYSFLHIFKHLMFEGIGLRQLMDYYYILMSLTDEERKDAMRTLEWMGLKRAVASIMYVEQSVFHLVEDKLLCNPDSKYGKLVLGEIMRSGNFGKYDPKMQELAGKNLVSVGIAKMKKMIGFFKICPSEVLWAPF